MLMFAYLAATIGLVQGLKFMSEPAHTKLGNLVAAVSVLVALVALVLATGWASLANLLLLVLLLAIGTVIGQIWSNRVAMTAMPQLVSIFNGLGDTMTPVLSAYTYSPGRKVTPANVTTTFRSPMPRLSVFIGWLASACTPRLVCASASTSRTQP